MKLIKALAIILLPVALVACNPFDKHVKCDDEAASKLVTDILKSGLNKGLEGNLKALIQNGSIKDLDPAKLKLFAQSVQYNLVDSRTEYVDPNSPKTSCAMDLTVTLPSDVLKKADEASVKLHARTLTEYASELKLDYANNKVELVLNYVVQPTDKGDKILVTVSNKNALETFLSETLTYAFLKPQIDKNEIQTIQENKIAAQQLAAEESSYYANEYASSEYTNGY